MATFGADKGFFTPLNNLASSQQFPKKCSAGSSLYVEIPILPCVHTEPSDNSGNLHNISTPDSDDETPIKQLYDQKYYDLHLRNKMLLMRVRQLQDSLQQSRRKQSEIDSMRQTIASLQRQLQLLQSENIQLRSQNKNLKDSTAASLSITRDSNSRIAVPPLSRLKPPKAFENSTGLEKSQSTTFLGTPSLNARAASNQSRMLSSIRPFMSSSRQSVQSGFQTERPTLNINKNMNTYRSPDKPELSHWNVPVQRKNIADMPQRVSGGSYFQPPTRQPMQEHSMNEIFRNINF